MHASTERSEDYAESLRDLTRYELMAKRRDLVRRLKPGISIQVTAIIVGEMRAISDELERRNDSLPTTYQRVQGWVVVAVIVFSIASCVWGGL